MGLVTADKTVEEQADVLLQKLGRKGQQPQQQQQVGLLLGRLSSTSSSSPSSTSSSLRDLLFGLVPTPPSPSSVAAAVAAASADSDSSRGYDGDGGAAAGSSSKKKGKGKGGKGGGAGSNADADKGVVSVQIDEEWVAEHARQVLRMCVGGVSVVGMFVVASDAAFKASAPAINIALAALRSTVRQHHQATAEAVAAVLQQHALCADAEEVAVPAAAAMPTAAAGDLLLLHISNGPKKLVLYNSGAASAAAASTSTALKPQELRVAASVVSSLVPMRTSFYMDTCIYIPSLPSSSTEAARQQWVAALRSMLLKAVVVAQARTLATARCARALAAETDSSDAATNFTDCRSLTLLDERDAAATVGDLIASGRGSEHSSSGSNSSSSKPSKRGGKGKGGGGGGSSANQPQSSSATPTPTLEIELLCLPSAACATVGRLPHTATNGATEGGSAAIDGAFRLRGRLCGVSYASPRDSMAAAVAELKLDVLLSLHHRLEIMLEDAEQQLEEEEEGEEEGEADGEKDGGAQEQQGAAAQEGQKSNSSRLLLWLLGDPTAEARHPATTLAAEAAAAGTTATRWQLPLRVLLPWTPLWDSSGAAADESSSTSKQAAATNDDNRAGGISLCDFLLASEAGEESPAVVAERFVTTVPAVIRGVAALASSLCDEAGMTGLRLACRRHLECPEASTQGNHFASAPGQTTSALETPPWSGGLLGAKEVKQSGAKPLRSEKSALAPSGLTPPSLNGSAASAALQMPMPLSWVWAIIVLLASLAAGSLLVSQQGQKL